MIVYGRNPVRETLRGRRAHQVTEIWATHGAVREPWLAGESLSASVRLHPSTPAEIERRCGSSAHQGVCAQVGGYPYVSAGELLSPGNAGGRAGSGGVGGATGSGGVGESGGSGESGDHGGSEPLIVALDEVQDPQNLGSICRTAECVGASGVAICERRAAEITPAACKASAGAVEHLRIARVRNLADFLGQAREAGCWCYGASAPAEAMRGEVGEGKGKEGESKEGGEGMGVGVRRSASATRGATIPYDAPDYAGAGVVLVLGSEGRGLRPRVASACDELIALPLRGRVGSLNVSAAAAALMYEILQRRQS